MQVALLTAALESTRPASIKGHISFINGFIYSLHPSTQIPKASMAPLLLAGSGEEKYCTIKACKAGKTWLGGNFVAKPSIIRRADWSGDMWILYKDYEPGKKTYSRRCIVIRIHGFTLGCDGHKTLKNRRCKVLALNLRFFTVGRIVIWQEKKKKEKRKHTIQQSSWEHRAKECAIRHEIRG